MRLFDALKQPTYLLLSVGISITFMFAYIYLQIQGIMENFFFWFTTVPYLNLAVFMTFTLIMGAAFSYQVYLRKNPKMCAIDITKSTGATSSLGFASFFISACPACASLGLFLLPASALAFIASYGVYINLLGIGMLLFVIYYLGGFKN
jgi:hypothetical protein